MVACPFCLIVRGEGPDAIVVMEDEAAIVISPLSPATRGHLLVIPKVHAPRLWELPADAAAAVMNTVTRVAGAAHRSLQPAGVNIIQSNGAAATQTVDHVHVHVVPRWRSDRMTLSWPRRAAESRLQQHDTANVIRKAMEKDAQAALPIPTAEDRRQHLSFIQSVVSRMASASASAKTWLLPIVTVAYGYAFVERDWFIAALGIVAVLVFALLDANYLKQERSFRKLYDRVARGEELPPFSMNPTVAGPDGTAKVNYWPDRQDLKSWAIAPFYLPMLAVGIGLLLYLAPWCVFLRSLP